MAVWSLCVRPPSNPLATVLETQGGGVHHRIDDGFVAGAATVITGQMFANLGARRIRMVF
jgi:hypothetical protein